MSDSAPKLHTFVVYAPDSTDEGAFARRMSVRETHLANARKAKEGGSLKMGGAMLSPESIINPADRKLVGSVMFFEAASLEEARQAVEADVYWTNNVWDHEKTVILPFLQASFP